MNHRIAKSIALLIATCFTIIGGVLLIGAAASATPDQTNTQINPATLKPAIGKLLVRNDIPKGYILCSVKFPGPDDKTLVLSASGQDYVFDLNNLPYGLDLPNAGATTTYYYSDNNPCNVYSAKYQQFRQSAVQSDKKGAWIVPAVCWLIAAPLWYLIFRNKEYAQSHFSDLYVAAAGPDIFKPSPAGAPTDIDIDDQGNITLSGGVSEVIAHDKIVKVNLLPILTYATTYTSVIKISLSDGSSLIISSANMSDVAEGYKNAKRAVIARLAFGSFGLLYGLRKSIGAGLEEENLILPLTGRLRTTLGSKLVAMPRSPEDKTIIELLVGYALFSILATVVLLVDHHLSSAHNVNHDDNLIAITGVSLAAIFLVNLGVKALRSAKTTKLLSSNT